MQRIGMNKNLRTGKIRYVTNKRIDDRQFILVDVKEVCVEAGGAEYIACYNLWVLVNDSADISRSDVGKFCEVGFYIQSFRDKDVSDKYDTILTMKSFRFLEDEDDAINVSRQISKSILN